MVNWKVVETQCQGSYLKILDGETQKVQIVSEPIIEISQKYGNKQYKMNVRVNGEDFSWTVSPRVLDEIGKALNTPEFVTGKKLVVSRKGEKSETRWTITEDKGEGSAKADSSTSSKKVELVSEDKSIVGPLNELEHNFYKVIKRTPNINIAALSIELNLTKETVLLFCNKMKIKGLLVEVEGNWSCIK